MCFESIKMSSIKCLSVILLASLLHNVANAKLDPSKYTVTFKYNDEVNWCLGGIIAENLVISSGECFADSHGVFFNFSNIKAQLESDEVDVESVTLFEFSKDQARDYHDFALVKLKQTLNLEQNALNFASSDSTTEDTTAFVNNDDSNKIEQVTIADVENCSNNNDISFFSDSQFCVELSNVDDTCSHQPGTPLLSNDDKLIGVYLDCYDETPYEIFARVSFFNELIKDVLAERTGPYIVHNYS